MTPVQASPSRVLTPELLTSLRRRIDLFHLNIILAKPAARYPSQTLSLSSFRGTDSVHAMLLNDFCNYVPATDYDSRKPWIARILAKSRDHVDRLTLLLRRIQFYYVQERTEAIRSVSAYRFRISSDSSWH